MDWAALITQGLGKLVSSVMSESLVPLRLSAEKVEQLSLLLKELIKWNRVHNLTALSEPEELVEVEILDSLAPLLFPEVGIPSIPPKSVGYDSDSVNEGAGPSHSRSCVTFADVGCGAGFPLLPLVVANERLCGVGIDGSQKRLAFVSHAVRVLGLGKRVRVIHKRAEEVEERFSLVMARALAAPERALELVRPLKQEKGAILLFLSFKDSVQLKDKYGGQVFQYRLPFSGRKRGIWVV